MEVWTHWLGQCHQNLAWGQNQEVWLSVQRQRRLKNEVICVHVACALNTRSHFCRILWHCGEFVLWLGDICLSKMFMEWFFCTSRAEKNEKWAGKGVACHTWGRHSPALCLSSSWALQLCKHLLQEISLPYTHCVYFASYNILNSPRKRKWMNYWSCAGENRGNRENTPWCDAASTHSSGVPGGGNPLVHCLGHSRWISGNFSFSLWLPHSGLLSLSWLKKKLLQIISVRSSALSLNGNWNSFLVNPSHGEIQDFLLCFDLL